MKFWIPAALASLVLLGTVATAQAAGAEPGDQAMVKGEYDSLVDAAAAKRREAEGLAVGGPCKSADQCAVLRFDRLGSCTGVAYKAYSLVSATAVAARAAAADYDALARQARAMVPPEAAGSCSPSGGLWKLECKASHCVRSEQGLWPQERGKTRP